ncbi:MAG: DUF1015 family protein [Endomicrobiia bacterium]
MKKSFLVEPFNGIRYTQKNLCKLICPPYDIISPQDKKELENLSPYNFVRIELPDNAKSAKNLLNLWANKKILIKEKMSSIYVYQQEFFISKKKFIRTGFFSALKLDPERIYKHERITLKPVQQRLELLKETKTCTSPIFCLFDDRKKGVQKILSKVISKKPAIEFTDKENIKHKLWILSDPKIVSKLKEKIDKSDIIIADGHHRFHTSLLYKEKNPLADRILAFLCSTEDKGVVILPTHRVVKNRPEIKQKIEKYFNLSRWDGKSKPQIVCYFNGEFNVLTPKNFSKLKEKIKNKLYLKVPAIILHKIILDEVNPEDIFYTKNIDEAVKEAQKINGYAFLLEAASIRSIFLLSKHGEIMPPKTTYFYPKIPAGIVCYSHGK